MKKKAKVITSLKELLAEEKQFIESQLRSDDKDETQSEPSTDMSEKPPASPTKSSLKRDLFAVNAKVKS